MQRVAVIGAGVSGLVSIKSCLEEGLEPICFEKEDFIGGTWVYREEDRSLNSPRIYQGMLINVCKEMMAFSDFPFPKDAPPFIRGTDILNYYRDYAEHFNLTKHIHFNTEVLTVEQADDYEFTGRWRISTRHRSDDTVITEEFDAVMVCPGLYTSAFIPKFSGLEHFKGEVVHSSQFRKGSEFSGKKVVVVGGSQSAGDISVLCADYADQLYMSVRHGTWVLPRVVNKEPQDANVNKRWKLCIPEWMQKIFMKQACMSLLDYRGLGLLSTRHPYNSSVMINDVLPIKVMSGVVKVRGQIQRFEGSTVFFDDGSSVDSVDSVIFATGFHHKVAFVDNSVIEDDLGKLELYLYILPPRLRHPTLTVIGYVEARGGTGPTAELQARWATQLFKGRIIPPRLKDMIAEIEETRAKTYDRYQLYRPRVSTVEYQDKVARSMGALPSLPYLLFTDPVLALHFFFGPALPRSYRLVGPHAMKNARAYIMGSEKRLMHGITLSTVRRKADTQFSGNIGDNVTKEGRFSIFGGKRFMFCTSCVFLCGTVFVASVM